MGTTINLVVVPALKASTDPVPAWRTVYNNGKNLALNMAISAATGYYLYAAEGYKRWLAAAILNSLVIPYTLFFMKPTNDALFAVKYKAGDVTTEEKSLLRKWGKLQWGRTLLGLGAFLIGIHTVLID